MNNEITNIHDYIRHSDVSQSCHHGVMRPQDEEGILICNDRKCGMFISYIADSSKPSNEEPPNEVPYTAYIKLNHFKEILSQFQAKETTQIPASVGLSAQSLTSSLILRIVRQRPRLGV